MPLEKVFRYKAPFKVFVKAAAPAEESQRFATASLADLNKVFSNSELANKIQKNPDLLFISSNLILCDYANLNDDCVRKSDVIKMHDQFVSKYINTEHDRSKVVGAICNVAFSSYPSNKVIDIQSALLSDEPVQLVIGGYVWRVVEPELADFIEVASNEASPSYGDVSTSFELMFDDYDIAIGPNGNRDVNAARIIDHSNEEFKIWDKILRANGGNGKTKDGDIVYRVLKGDILPTGIGIVAKPASGLKGILAISDIVEEKPVEAKQDNIDEIKDKNINNTESSVKTPITLKSMKIEKLEDLDKIWSEIKSLETSASVTEFIVASTREQIEKAIAEESVKFAAEIKAQKDIAASIEESKVKAEADKAEADKRAKELETVVATLKKELEDVKAAQLAAASEEKFNARMAAFDEEFDLDDEDRQIIAQDLRALATDDSDEDDSKFKGYMGKQKKLMKEKCKSVKKAKAEELAALASKTGKTETIDPKLVIASVTEIVGQEISNGVHTTESLRDKYKASFNESVSIGGVQLKNFNK
jgi:hypothetical protein